MTLDRRFRTEPAGGPSPIRLVDRAVLEVWEEGRGGTSPQRTAALLRAAFGGSKGGKPEEGPEAWPLGLRDARLMEAMEATFGPRAECLAVCPRCEERMEFSVRLSDLGDRWAGEGTRLEIEAGDPPYRVGFRLPDTADLATVAHEASPDAARRSLAVRCVVEAERDGREVDARSLPDDVVDEMDRAMAEADPQALVWIAVECPQCGHRRKARFDVAEFFWEEVDGRAHALLAEVHALARAYGWSEAEVLAVPEARRRAYLDLVLG